MKKIIFILYLLLFLEASASEEKNCFLARENDSIIQQEGDCSTRYSPASTFKIPLSLMGYDCKILKNATHPEWQFKDGYEFAVNVCKKSHTPREWMRDSCVWYSQILTQKLGVKRFRDYIVKFSYGNQDISGDKGQNNGLTHSWLSSSLEISPEEQTVFLQKLVDGKLEVSSKASELTKNIMFREELQGGWKLYGKTGTGRLSSQGESEQSGLQHGWFVGWIEKDGRVITFASHIINDTQQNTFASFLARNKAQNKLWYLIDSLEK